MSATNSLQPISSYYNIQYSNDKHVHHGQVV